MKSKTLKTSKLQKKQNFEKSHDFSFTEKAKKQERKKIERDNMIKNLEQRAVRKWYEYTRKGWTTKDKKTFVSDWVQGGIIC